MSLSLVVLVWCVGPLQDGDNKTVRKTEKKSQKAKEDLIIAHFDFFFVATVTK